MATLFYLPASGSAPVTPSSWIFANQIASPLTAPTDTTKANTAMATLTGDTGTTSPITKGMARYVYGPLSAQTISGTVRAVARMRESNTGANAQMALAIKIIQADGSDRATLLTVTSSDSATSPYELTTTLSSRRPWTAAETEPLTLTSQAASDGDYLVIEVGFRSATTTSRTIDLRTGDNAASNLTYGDGETNDFNGWVEFSGSILKLITGDLTKTLDNITTTADGTNLVAGTLSKTLDAFTTSAAGANLVSGEFSKNLDDFSLSADGTVSAGTIVGDASITLDNFTLSGAGVVDVQGNSTIVIDDIALSGAGGVLVVGDSNLTLDDVALSGAGGVLVIGDSNLTLDDVALSGAGGVSVQGDAVVSLDDITLVGDGVVTNGPVGDANIVLDDVSINASGTVAGGLISAPVSHGGGRRSSEPTILPEILSEEYEAEALFAYDNEIVVISSVL